MITIAVIDLSTETTTGKTTGTRGGVDIAVHSEQAVSELVIGSRQLNTPICRYSWTIITVVDRTANLSLTSIMQDERKSAAALGKNAKKRGQRDENTNSASSPRLEKETRALKRG